jgi:hypothetical protein
MGMRWEGVQTEALACSSPAALLLPLLLPMLLLLLLLHLLPPPAPCAPIHLCSLHVGYTEAILCWGHATCLPSGHTQQADACLRAAEGPPVAAAGLHAAGGGVSARQAGPAAGAQGRWCGMHAGLTS